MATYTDNYQLTLPTYAETADIATINNNMTKIDEIMHDSQISIATAYDASTTSENPYNTGDIVMYEKIAYKCKYDGVYGTWDASKWEQTTLADNLGGGDASEISYDNTTSGLTADNVQEAIDELEGNIEDVSDGLDDAVESLAPAYDSTQTYDEGDIVSYQNKLYECNTDQTTGTWNAQYWDEYIISENMGASVSIIPETIEEPKRKVADYTIDGVSGSIYQSTMAEQLDSETGETDTAPYLFRASPQLDIPYERMTTKLVGGTVAWNQLVQNGDFSTTGNWAGRQTDSLVISDGTAKLTAKVTSNNNQIYSTNISGLSIGHKYLMGFSAYKSSGSTTEKIQFGFFNSSTAIDITRVDVTTTKTRYSAVFNLSDSATNIRFGHYSNITIGDVITYDDIILVDLTQAFGSAIADYIYTLEQATAGSGIAWLQSYGFLTKDYYAYNVGSLESVKTSALNTRGFNQFDKSTIVSGKVIGINGTEGALASGFHSGYIKAIPNTVYYVSDTSISSYVGVLANYDENKTFIGFSSSYSGNTKLRQTLPNTSYIIVNALNTVIDTLNVNIHYDGERDGEYEAYSEHTYVLDSDLELRGMYKLDSNNNLVCDGDVYHSNGTVNRRYGIVDLGTLGWTYTSSGQGRFIVLFPNAKIPPNQNTRPNIVCSSYETVTPTQIHIGTRGISVNTDGFLWVHDSSYTDATTFKTAMSGVYLVYELATSTTETADAFQEPQIVDNWGTEEFVDTRTVPVPVGHDSLYLTDMRKKLEKLPIIPPPSSNGTYVLVCTVASGKPSYSWETYTTTRSAKSEPQEEVKEEPKEEEETKEEQR